MKALVDFPIAEAEALLKRTDPDSRGTMTTAEWSASERARARIARAVGVERSAGGSAFDSRPATPVEEMKVA